ncbi:MULTISPECIES: 2Fe-2S iron-sulfur cluster binding domain-containing protein [Sphingobium]|jgi:ferredoxin|uniref:2Fe-2S iron-sulfur cluster binding domain-containing protein n=2 Tax=Sphingobium TaxID=165695 RepID=A0A4V1W8U2_SPHSA|nr:MULTISPECIES: 2Fe-2S iron-sulfur cluster binding domain-containing protein [Sphingobium]AJR23848.1 ferredoxin [Sphingobium sp. YBL2]MCB4862183.1 2Fe-2S iron-sulfur cluster binding domain-containing protein [Sphingobium sp. PNB]QOT73612.1 2Fe-2S iron-sulfur cluster binding domain-containing protein [Sphingobium fuliginis]RYL97256.1 2Fe-2S iron-sulfur cluster binding domain-containing protein [Sphingobium fuliginis]WDA35670.1 2Fe-2S iron-sulfur cluster binding domain-containing protein [Sphin
MDDRDVEGLTQAAPFQIEIGGVRFPCRADQSLLAAMIASGRKALAVGCRSGGCGVCRIRIQAGRCSTGHMNRAVVSAADEQAGIVLACRAYPSSDIRAVPLPRASFGAAPVGRAA